MAIKLPVKINQIRELLPHRYPFLLVDRVIELDEKRIVAIKNVSVNEPFFNGHFPEAPLMPGVLQVEALAQTAGLFSALAAKAEDKEKNNDKIGVFTRVDNCTFEKPVVPGDRLRLEVTISNVERSKKGDVKKVSAHAVATVDDKITCQADLEFGMVPKKLLSR